MTQIKHNARGTSGLNVSFEFFPPKTETMEQTLWSATRDANELKGSIDWLDDCNWPVYRCEQLARVPSLQP